MSRHAFVKGLVGRSSLREQSRLRVNPQFVHSRQLSRCPLDPKNPFVKVSDEVRAAIDQQKPVVALESTIYTHGFPYPDNIALASSLESIVRLHGGTPATIGVLRGVARIGFSNDELIELTASAGKSGTRKASRRDIAYLLGLGYINQKLHGGTTISGTMVLANMANIDVFATGGLGGVHRGVETSMDISTDLTELGRTRMALVSSGCKSFLDIPRTLEYLETEGVCVGTFSDGRSDQVEFPAFWTRDSGYQSPLTVKNEEEAASMFYAQSRLGLTSGLLFANPIPAGHSIPKGEMDKVIDQAIREAQASGASGKDNTPFVLRRIREITGGQSVTANRVLVESNVARGTKLALHLARLRQSSDHPGTSSISDGGKQSVKLHSSISKPFPGHGPSFAPQTNMDTVSHPADVLVAGSLAVDYSCDFKPLNDTESSITPQLHTSNPASITQSLGGVGLNIASALHYLETSMHFCSNVGDDNAGSNAIAMLDKRGLQTAGIRKTAGRSTGQYVAVNDGKKSLVLGMADMSIMEASTGDFKSSWRPQLKASTPKWLAIDATWDPVTLKKWFDAAKALGAKVAFEPVSVAKSRRIFARGLAEHEKLAAVPNHSIDMASPNDLELSSMHEAANVAGSFEREDWWKAVDSMGLPSSGSTERLVALANRQLADQGIPQQCLRLLPFIPSILVTLGEQGVLLTQLLQPDDGRLTSPESAPYILSRSTNGNDTVGGVLMRLFPPVELVTNEEVVSVNGAGDTFLGVMVAGLSKENAKNIDQLVNVAQKGSVMTLRSPEPVNPEISTLKSAL